MVSKFSALLVCFSTALVFLSSCDKEKVKYDNLSTPDVTTLGILTPVAVYTSSYLETGEDIEEDVYKMRYSRDNQLQSLEYETGYGKWSMTHNPLSFDYKGDKFYHNFKFNDAGCVTYFERSTNSSSIYKFKMTYDENNYLISLIEEFGDSYSEYRIYWEDGSIDRIDMYDKDEIYDCITFNYGYNSINNNDGIFFEFYSLEPFMCFSGLLGRPSAMLPTGYSYSIGIDGSYTYETRNGRVYGIKEVLEIEGEYEDVTYYHSFTYRGIYNNLDSTIGN